MARKCYIAQYPTPDVEVMLLQREYWDDDIDATFDRLAANYQPGDAPIQAWYADDYQAKCMGTIG